MVVSWLVARLLARTRTHLFLFPFGIIIVMALFWLAMPTYMGGIQPPKDGGMRMQARVIADVMWAYAEDNYRYPDGKSSTDVFQKLIDGGYLTDPGVLYLRLPGKRKGEPGRRLHPENVCWDLTTTPDGKIQYDVPLVYPTGYAVSYRAGAPAIPRVKPYPPYSDRAVPSWWDQVHGWPLPNPVLGIGVADANGEISFLKLSQSNDGSWSIPSFIPADFDSTRKAYQQLTPEGVLPP